MATIINNPDSGDKSGSGVGMVIGIIALVVVLIVFFVYALPAITGSGSNKSNGTTIEVPDKIQVDVNK